MSLNLRLEIEGLSDKSWARIERRLFERVEMGEIDANQISQEAKAPAPWRMAAAMMAVGAMVAIGGGWIWGALAAAPQQAVQAPWRVVTGASGMRVGLGDAAIDLAPHSSLSIRQDDARSMTIRLEEGRGVPSGTPWGPFVAPSESATLLASAPAQVQNIRDLHTLGSRLASWPHEPVEWVVY